MRGKGVEAYKGSVLVGITPAHAGKSPVRSVSRKRYWDHPRACGEKIEEMLVIIQLIGSPPRMRGKGQFHTGVVAMTGITPAHAGKRTNLFMNSPKARDHPRACGEKRPVSRYDFGHGGSPPRMRGKGVICTIPRGIFGITPAHAGKSLLQGSLCRLFAGSPPRMRGKVLYMDCKNAFPRITPAHAGKSIRIHTKRTKTKDHPRACGEKNLLRLIFSFGMGSPPRMRGKALLRQIGCCVVGITPAHAGKSGSTSST